jgi:site-specific DNA-cytosine methylase
VATRTYRALFPFGGSAGGALGFQQAEVRLLGAGASFEVIGSVDLDPMACMDFETLTGAPALCRNIASMTAPELRAFAGPRAPDCVFMSPPCKGASGLLSAQKANTRKYREMNRLALVCVKLLLAAWPDEPPRLILLENVPRLKQRAGRMLRAVRSLLHRAGYVFNDGFHDCGELGGLAQHRRRYLLVARHARRVPPLLYKPPPKRVRACGEVLSELPVPGTPEAELAGPMHVMPRISWLNWVRLALIPAGGDWRDLEGVLANGQARREVFRRHKVERWDAPADTVAGSGSNGPSAVADPRLTLPSCQPDRHHNKYRVYPWSEPAGTVIGATRPGSGAPSVADPRVRVAYDHGYGVLRWDESSSTVAGGSDVGQGAYSVADVRARGNYYRGTYGVMGWQEACGTITGNARIDAGRFAVADPRRPPPSPVVIVAADGTWHRPLTTLELAALQGFPSVVDGAPLVLAGTSTGAWRERIGNAVPPPTARAIAERMLVTLVQADAEAFTLSGGLEVWVEDERRSTC